MSRVFPDALVSALAHLGVQEFFGGMARPYPKKDSIMAKGKCCICEVWTEVHIVTLNGFKVLLCYICERKEKR